MEKIFKKISKYLIIIFWLAFIYLLLSTAGLPEIIIFLLFALFFIYIFYKGVDYFFEVLFKTDLSKLHIFLAFMPLLIFMSLIFPNDDFLLNFLLMATTVLSSSLISPLAKFYSSISSSTLVTGSVLCFLYLICAPQHHHPSSKSKTSEAKIQLAALYNAEVGSNAQFGTYSTCLDDIGFERSPRGYYILGFGSHDEVSVRSLRRQGQICLGLSYSVPEKLLAVTGGSSIANEKLLISVLKKLKQDTTKNSFTAYAIGNVGHVENEIDLDIWSINERKELKNIQQGNYKTTRKTLSDKIITFFTGFFK